MLNVNTGGVDDTLRGFDPNMRIPRFRNRRLGDLPRPLQMEVINSLIANGVRGSRVANGVVNGAGIRNGGVDIIQEDLLLMALRGVVLVLTPSQQPGQMAVESVPVGLLLTTGSEIPFLQQELEEYLLQPAAKRLIWEQHAPTGE